MDWSVMFNDKDVKGQLLSYKGKSEFTWLPFIVIDESTSNLLGLSDSAMWVCGKGNSLHDVSDPRSGFLLVPILNEDLSSFVRRFKKGVADKKISEDVLLSFPFDSLMCAGIQGAASSVDRAYDWVDQGYPVGRKVAECFASRNIDVPEISESDDDIRIKNILSLSS